MTALFRCLLVASASATLSPALLAQVSSPVCSYSLGADLSVPAAGGTFFVPLPTLPVCPWMASSQAGWIGLSGNTSGVGTAQIGISVAPNPSQTARIGTVRIADRTLTVTQAGQTCSYTLTPASATAPAAGGLGTIRIASPAGCAWSARSLAPWLTVSTASRTGSGNSEVEYAVAANPTLITRAGTLLVAGKVFVVTQPAQAMVCSASAGAPLLARSPGLTELTSDLVVLCTGTVPAGGATLDISATLNTELTSRLLPGGAGDTEATLLVDEPASPVLGTTAFRGKLSGYSTVRFAGITLPAGPLSRTFRIVNLRANARSIAGKVSALVEVKSNCLVSLERAKQTIAILSDAMTASAGEVGAGPAAGTLALPISFNEGFASAFRVRVAPSQSPSQPGITYQTESGFLHAALGPTVGLADTGTRLRLAIGNIPAGVRVYAPLAPVSGSGARLLGEDAFLGAGSDFGGAYQELPVIGGAALAQWEIDAANPAAVESYLFPIVFGNATQQQVEQIRPSIAAALAPLSGAQQATASTIPRFLDPAAPQSRVNLRVSAGPVTPAAGFAPAKLMERSVVAGNYAFPYTVLNDSSEPATEVILRGNLPPGFTIPSCSSSAGQCSTSGNEFTVNVPSLSGGSSVNVNVIGGPTGELDPGYFIEGAVSVSSAQFDTDLESNRVSSGLTVESCAALGATSANVPASGGAFSVSVPACSLWTAWTETPWIRIDDAGLGSGAGQVTYSVEPNPGGARTGILSLAGQSFLVNQQPNSGTGGCAYTLTPSAATVGAAGVRTTFALTASGSNCAWTASSNASWAQMFPPSGAGSATIYYRVFPNVQTAGRSAVLTVGGQPFLIQQSGNTGTRMQRLVQLAYFSFLGRVPSAPELDFHVNSGLPERTMLRNFWNSDEFAFGGRMVAALYVGLLERDPEYSGWQFQRLALSGGEAGQVTLTDNFLQSAEFTARNGALDNTAYVNFLYTRALGRTPSPGEAAGQLAALRAGVSRAQLAVNFLSSPEFRAKTTERLHAFLLHSSLLLRDGSVQERQSVMSQLAGGTAVDALIAAYAASAEFNQLLQ